MVFDTAVFIKPDMPFEKSFQPENPAPMFRKTVWLDQTEGARLYVCGLGYGYYYINGKPVSGDLFTAPVSDYNKTLWYNVYSVSDLLVEGENTIAVILGNGWYNESFKSSWDYNEAPWRDNPKFILQLEIGGKAVIATDDTWKCMPRSATVFNALRSGEYFDARLYDANWNAPGYAGAHWGRAVKDPSPPRGKFRECLCEPVTEHEVYECTEVFQAAHNRYVFDFGQNMSGYVRLSAAGKSGDTLVLRYAEQIMPDYSRNLNGMGKFYPESEFQTDRFICSGERVTWSPKFTYHGFRYIEIEGIRDVSDVKVQAVFVHQAIEERTQFQCSDAFINQLFCAGQMSSYSNMFYMLTDCPTREKLGWANDAQASAEQLLTNFKIEKLFSKWLTDIYDAMRQDGALPGIIPTGGWGYQWGNGPVSDGILFEIPYLLYLHTGDSTALVQSLPWFDRYFDYLKGKTEGGLVTFGLDDWANPGTAKTVVPASFINMVLMYHFYSISCLAGKIAETPEADRYSEEAERLKSKIMSTCIDDAGKCVINEQTAVAMLIYYDLYKVLEPMKQQLKTLVEEAGFHHSCGMVGMRRLFPALNKCKLYEYAFKILKAEGYPSYKAWLDSGATTLYEYWDASKGSKNHHMYSDFMSWIIKTILGISIDTSKPGKAALEINPYFFKELAFAEGRYETAKGMVAVQWRRNGAKVDLMVVIDGGVSAVFRGMALNPGENRFEL